MNRERHRVIVITEGGKGGWGWGSKSRFSQNKTVLLQFTKNKDTMKITVHGELNIFISRFTENNFAQSRFTTTMEITIHEEKISHFTFHGEKKGRSRVMKIPFTTLITNYKF